MFVYRVKELNSGKFLGGGKFILSNSGKIFVSLGAARNKKGSAETYLEERGSLSEVNLVIVKYSLIEEDFIE